jgi:alkylation response protein AidB-like acyl-CoA dehydrogenase
MHFALSTEQRELAATVRSLIDRRAGDTDLRAALSSDTGYDLDLWHALCGQIGAAALAIPESLGGAGFSSFETHVVLEQLGATLTPSPLLGSGVLATQALLLLDNRSPATELLSDLAAGARVAAVCWADRARRWRTDGSDVRAEKDGSAIELHGSASLVLDGATADTLVVVAVEDHVPGLYLVEDNAAGVTRSATPGLDPTLRFARVDFHRTPATRVGMLDAGRLSQLRLRAKTAVTALQVGAADEALHRTIEYLGERVQFERPLASFQAVKHRCADLLVDVETARSISWSAAWTIAHEPDSAAAHHQAGVAASWCADAFRRVTAEMVQLHGGIAITWEHDAHLYFKRAHATSILFGAPHEYRRDIIGTVAARAAAAVA